MLEFSRIQAGQKTVYLCTTEVSFGVFAQVVNDANCLADLDNAGKPEAQAHWFRNRRRAVGMARASGRSPTASSCPTMTGWCCHRRCSARRRSAAYPGAAPAKPGAEQPMQQITPWAAMYFRALLGCRLPTSDEWKASYEKSESEPRGAAGRVEPAPAGWLAEHEYARKIAAKGLQYPDQGIFWSPTSSSRASPPTPPNPGRAARLAKLAPARISNGAGVYPTSQIWFRKVGAQPGVSPPGQGNGGFHDLVGNVAEYVFDAPGANAVTKDNKVSVDSVNTLIGAESKDLFVIGGSSLSPPEVPDPANAGKFIVNAFNVKQPVPRISRQPRPAFPTWGSASPTPRRSIRSSTCWPRRSRRRSYLPPSKTPR